MTISYPITTLNARLNAIAALADAGATGALILIQDGTRPATGGALTNTLSTLVMSTTAFITSTVGVLTANAITDDSSAAASGTGTWFRVTDSSGVVVMDGDIGTDMVITPSAVITAASPVSASSMTITSANA
jgi:hypothetical protein